MRNFFLVATSVIFFSNVFAQAPVITKQPINLLECIGSSGEIWIEATGEAPLAYQWFKNNVVYTSGSSLLSFASLAETDEGEYYCVVSNGLGTATSEVCEVFVVNGAPVINSISSQHNLVCLGTNNLFNANISGENYNARWYHNDDIVSNTFSYNLISAQLVDEGFYYCQVINACATVFSDSLTIDVVLPVSITIDPETAVVCEGEDVTFSPTVTGDFPYYMWRKNNVNILTEQNNSITIHNVTYPNADQYNLVVYNVCNSDTSNTVFIQVNNIPQVVGQPINHYVCPSENIILYAYAGGTTEASYQWYNLNDGEIIGETDDYYAVPSVAGSSSSYYCEMSNLCGSVFSDTALVVFKQSPIITQQPVGDEVCAGENVNLLVKATGTEVILFQWLFNGTDVNGANITGSEESVMLFNQITSGQSGFYSCHVSNACGFLISDTVEVVVNIPGVVAEQPQGLVICEGEELLLDITAQGTEPLSFEWFILDGNVSIGEETDYYNESAMPENSGSYFCVLSNMCGEISTDTVSVEVRALPQITTDPVDIDVCVGDFVEMSVTATGSGPLDFLWYRNGSSVSSQTSSTLSIAEAQVNQTGDYFCRVINDCGYEDSEIASLTIGTAPAITWNPINQTLCELETLDLIMDAQGDNYNLQWYLNDLPIPGENDTVLNYTLINQSLSGTYYCLAYNACATVSTDTVVVEINPAPALELGNNIDLCTGETVIIGPSTTYNHYNWNNGLSYQPELEIHLGGTFILDVTGPNNCHNYDTIVVTFHPYHNILFTQDTVIACGTYIVNAGAGAYSYLWNTNPIQTTPTITVNNTGTYSVTCTGDSFGCSTSGSVFIDARAPISFSLGNDLTAPVDSFVNVGIGHTFSEYIWNTGFTGPTLTVYGSTYGVGTHEFWLTAYALNGCSDTDTINVTFYNNSGIENDFSEKEIIAYPNPATDIIVFKSEDFEMQTVEFYNISGELVLKEIINSWEFSFNVSNFAKGLYLVKISGNNNKLISTKILIQ